MAQSRLLRECKDEMNSILATVREMNHRVSAMSAADADRQRDRQRERDIGFGNKNRNSRSYSDRNVRDYSRGSSRDSKSYSRTDVRYQHCNQVGHDPALCLSRPNISYRPDFPRHHRNDYGRVQESFHCSDDRFGKKRSVFRKNSVDSRGNAGFADASSSVRHSSENLKSGNELSVSQSSEPRKWDTASVTTFHVACSDTAREVSKVAEDRVRLLRRGGDKVEKNFYRDEQRLKRMRLEERRKKELLEEKQRKLLEQQRLEKENAEKQRILEEARQQEILRVKAQKKEEERKLLEERQREEQEGRRIQRLYLEYLERERLRHERWIEEERLRETQRVEEARLAEARREEEKLFLQSEERILQLNAERNVYLCEDTQEVSSTEEAHSDRVEDSASVKEFTPEENPETVLVPVEGTVKHFYPDLECPEKISSAEKDLVNSEPRVECQNFSLPVRHFVLLLLVMLNGLIQQGDTYLRSRLRKWKPSMTLFDHGNGFDTCSRLAKSDVQPVIDPDCQKLGERMYLLRNVKAVRKKRV